MSKPTTDQVVETLVNAMVPAIVEAVQATLAGEKQVQTAATKRQVKVKNPRAAATYRQRVYIAAATGYFPGEDSKLTKGQASIAIERLRQGLSVEIDGQTLSPKPGWQPRK